MNLKNMHEVAHLKKTGFFLNPESWLGHHVLHFHNMVLKTVNRDTNLAGCTPDTLEIQTFNIHGS